MYSVQYMTHIWSSLRCQGFIAFSMFAWSRNTAQRYQGLAQRRSEWDIVTDRLIGGNLYHSVLLSLLRRADAGAPHLLALGLRRWWVDLHDCPGPVFRFLGVARSDNPAAPGLVEHDALFDLLEIHDRTAFLVLAYLLENDSVDHHGLLAI